MFLPVLNAVAAAASTNTNASAGFSEKFTASPLLPLTYIAGEICRLRMTGIGLVQLSAANGLLERVTFRLHAIHFCLRGRFESCLVRGRMRRARCIAGEHLG